MKPDKLIGIEVMRLRDYGDVKNKQDKLKRPNRRNEPDRQECAQGRFACSIISFAGDAEIAFGLLPDRPDRQDRLNRPISGSGPDPYGLVASLRCVIELPAHSEKGPSKKSCYSGTGVA